MRRTVPRRFLGTRYRIMASAELKIRAPRGSLARSVVPRFRDCGDIRFSFVHANADDCNYVSKTRIPRLEYSPETCDVMKLASNLYE